MYTVTFIRSYYERIQVNAYSEEAAIEAARKVEDQHAELIDEEVDSIEYEEDEPEDDEEEAS